jgi:hypothetical protein
VYDSAFCNADVNITVRLLSGGNFLELTTDGYCYVSSVRGTVFHGVVVCTVYV